MKKVLVSQRQNVQSYAFKETFAIRMNENKMCDIFPVYYDDFLLF